MQSEKNYQNSDRWCIVFLDAQGEMEGAEVCDEVRLFARNGGAGHEACVVGSETRF